MSAEEKKTLKEEPFSEKASPKTRYYIGENEVSKEEYYESLHKAELERSDRK